MTTPTQTPVVGGLLGDGDPVRCALDGAELGRYVRAHGHYDDEGVLDGVVVEGPRRRAVHRCGVRFAMPKPVDLVTDRSADAT